MPGFMCCRRSSGKIEPGVLAGSNTKPDPNLLKPIIRIFEERIQTKKIESKKTAIHFSDRATLTFNQVNSMGSCMAKNITERLGYEYKVNNPEGELVIAISLPLSEKAIALILGVLKVGAAYIPLDPDMPERLLLDVLMLARPVMLITDDNGKIFNKYDINKFTDICKVCSVEELWIDTDFALEEKSRRASIEQAWDIDFLDGHPENKTPIPERSIVLIHSHGLRNNPVIVRLSNNSIMNLVSYHWSKFKMSSKDAYCVTVSMASAESLPQIFVPLLLGSTLYIFRRVDLTDMDNFAKNVSWSNITSLSIPTHHLGEFLNCIDFHGRDKMAKSFNRLKHVICRGAYITSDQVKLFFAIFKTGVTLSNTSGSIETTVDVACEMYKSLKDYESKLHVERPTLSMVVDNSKIYILDDKLDVVKEETLGQICVSGDCLALGYVKQDDQSGEKFGFTLNPYASSPKLQRLFRTGEYGRIVKGDGGTRVLYLEGRQDSLVKVRANIFSTDDVRNVIKDALETVEDCAIFVTHEDANANEVTLTCYAILAKGLKEADVPNQADFEFTLKEVLPEWAIPNDLKIVDKLPSMQNG